MVSFLVFSALQDMLKTSQNKFCTAYMINIKIWHEKWYFLKYQKGGFTQWPWHCQKGLKLATCGRFKALNSEDHLVGTREGLKILRRAISPHLGPLLLSYYLVQVIYKLQRHLTSLIIKRTGLFPYYYLILILHPQ